MNTNFYNYKRIIKSFEYEKLTLSINYLELLLLSMYDNNYKLIPQFLPNLIQHYSVLPSIRQSV